MTKTRTLSAGLAFIAIALAMWALSIWPFGGEHVAAPTHRTPATAPPTEARDAELADTTAERQTIELDDAPASAPSAPTPATAADTEPETVPVAAWSVRLRVVDEQDQPVANATVTAWAGRRKVGNSGGSQMVSVGGHTYSGRVEPALVELRTDVEGRAQATFAVELVFVEARKDSLGRSDEFTFWNQHAREREVILVLHASRVLRGLVLRADGAPAAGAHVKATTRMVMMASPPVPDAVTAGTDGRFDLIVQRFSRYYLQAELLGAWTLPESVRVQAEPPEVTLRFPGGITLQGVVVDANGAPVANADVSSWREFTVPARPADEGFDAHERGWSETDVDGRFSISVRRHARYQVIARKHGYANSEAVWLEPTEVRPHAEVRLLLRPLSKLRGRVERGDGSAFAGASVSATADQGDPTPRTDVPTQLDLYGGAAPVTVGADGRFDLRVHPDTTWTVVARPQAKSHIEVERSGVAPSSDDVVLRLTDADLATCTVHGVVSRDDGEPLDLYEVLLVTGAADKPPKATLVAAEFDGPRFTLAGLQRGQRYSLCVRRPGTTGGAAPVLVGPFTTDQSELKLEFRMPSWGRVPVRVRDATGAPAAKVRVAIESAARVHTMQQTVGPDGAVVPWCMPGASTLRVFLAEEVVHQQSLHVAPGLNPEVAVQLAAGK